MGKFLRRFLDELGKRQLTAGILKREAKHGDRCEKIVKSGRELPKIAMDLIAKANENGGKDNIAVVLAQPLTGEVEQC